MWAVGRRREHPKNPGFWGTALVLLAAGAAVAIWRLKIYQWEQWDLGAWDTGIYLQALWLIAHGHFLAFDTFVQKPILADAAQYILYPLALPFRWGGPSFAFGVEALALGSALWPLGRLATEALGAPGLGWLLALAGLFQPAVVGNIAYEWHPDVFGFAALLWLLWADRKEKPGPYYLALVVTLLSKNQAAVPVALYAIIRLAGPDRRRRHLWTLLSAGGLLIFNEKMLLSLLHHTDTNIAKDYGYLGQGLIGILLGMLHRPGTVWVHLFGTPAYWGLLLVPLAFLPILAPVQALPGLLTAGLNLLGVNPLQRSPFSQYALWVEPFMLVAAIGGLARLRRSSGRLGQWTTVFGIMALLLLTAGSFFGQTLPYVAWRFHPRPAREAFEAARRLIPPGAPVFGQTGTTARLYDRIDVASFPYDDLGGFLRRLQGRHQPLYVLYAPQAVFVNIVSPTEKDARLARLFGAVSFRTLYDSHGVYLWRSTVPAGLIWPRYRDGRTLYFPLGSERVSRSASPRVYSG